MRPLILLLPVLSLGACTDAEGPEPARPTASIASPTAPTAPTEVRCPEGDPMHLIFDSPGHRRFTGLLASWSEELGRPVVDREARAVWFVRTDGTAHTRLAWTRARQPAEGREWFVDGLEQCRDHAEWTSLTAPRTPVELEVGHCWVEPVEVDGRTWDVIGEDQFGSGGQVPRGLTSRRDLVDRFVLSGALTVAGDVAIYVDQSGVRLTLAPEGDPWTLERRGCA